MEWREREENVEGKDSEESVEGEGGRRGWRRREGEGR